MLGVYLGAVLARPLQRLIFKNHTFAWWFLLSFGITGVITGASLLFSSAWFLKGLGLVICVAYSVGLYFMRYAHVHFKWASFCDRSYNSSFD